MNIAKKLRGRADRFRIIYLWKKFAKEVRSNQPHLLSELAQFDNPILVAGCQRSGTTALSRVITSSDGMVNFRSGVDDELDAALILSGSVKHSPQGRYCFQTTYLNERYTEYTRSKGKYQLIWMIRNPFSVVHSIMDNWSTFAFDELFESCGLAAADKAIQHKFKKYGKSAIPKIERACLAYNGKTSQLFDLSKNLDSQQLLVIDYDLLVKDKANILPDIYNFINLEFKKSYCEKIRSDSVDKASRLSSADRAVVEQLCSPVYKKAKSFHYDFDARS